MQSIARWNTADVCSVNGSEAQVLCLAGGEAKGITGGKTVWVEDVKALPEDP